MMRMISLWTVFVLLLALSAACSSPGGSPTATDPEQASGSALEQDAPPTPALDTIEVELDQFSPKETERPTQEDCPGVDSQLFQVIQSPNPLELAEELQIRIKDDKVQVLLILADPDTGFLQRFQVEVGTQSSTKVQAFVPITQLCELASTDQVLAIRLPSGAAPQ